MIAEPTGTDGLRLRSHQCWSTLSSRMGSSIKGSSPLSNCSGAFPRSLFRRDRHGLLAVLAINYSSTPHYLTEESYQDSRGCLMGSLVSQFEPCDGYLGYLFEKLASFLVEACKMRV